MDRGTLTRVLNDGAVFRGQECALDRPVLALEVVADVLHLDPFDAVFAADVFD